MIVKGIIFFDEQEIDVETISEELKVRIIAECPPMAHAVWDIPIPEDEPETAE